MRDLKYEQLWFPLPPVDLAFVETPELRDLASVFFASMERVHNMIEFPSHLIGIAMRYQLAGTLLALEIEGGSDIPHEGDGSLSAGQRAIVIEMGVKDIQDDARLNEHRSIAFGMFLKIVQRYEMNDDVEKLLASMLVSTWTALEVLILDTLRTCASQFPEKLSQPLAVSEIAFQKLTTIRKVYDDVFADLGVHLALGERSIDGLSLLRHLLVHRNGHVDHKFKGDCQKAGFCAWAELPEEGFPMDGGLVHEYVEKNYHQGIAFLKAVDKFLHRYDSPT